MAHKFHDTSANECLGPAVSSVSDLLPPSILKDATRALLPFLDRIDVARLSVVTKWFGEFVTRARKQERDALRDDMANGRYDRVITHLATSSQLTSASMRDHHIEHAVWYSLGSADVTDANFKDVGRCIMIFGHRAKTRHIAPRAVHHLYRRGCAATTLEIARDHNTFGWGGRPDDELPKMMQRAKAQALAQDNAEVLVNVAAYGLSMPDLYESLLEMSTRRNTDALFYLADLQLGPKSERVPFYVAAAHHGHRRAAMRLATGYVTGKLNISRLAMRVRVGVDGDVRRDLPRQRMEIERDGDKALEFFKIATTYSPMEPVQNVMRIAGRLHAYCSRVKHFVGRAGGVRFLEHAAENGYSFCANVLGDLFENGKGVPRDERTAFDWYTRGVDSRFVRPSDHATQNGVRNCHRSLGRMYEHGRGVDRCVVSAVTHYHLSQSSTADVMRLFRDQHASCVEAYETPPLRLDFFASVCKATERITVAELMTVADYLKQRGCFGAASQLYGAAADRFQNRRACFELGCIERDGLAGRGSWNAALSLNYFERAQSLGHPDATVQVAAMLERREREEAERAEQFDEAKKRPRRV